MLLCFCIDRIFLFLIKKIISFRFNTTLFYFKIIIVRIYSKTQYFFLLDYVITVICVHVLYSSTNEKQKQIIKMKAKQF